MTELMICPFCGHRPRKWGEDGHPHGIEIECVNGHCPAEPHVWMATEAEAITAWNTRAAGTAPHEVDALAKAASALWKAHATLIDHGYPKNSVLIGYIDTAVAQCALHGINTHFSYPLAPHICELNRLIGDTCRVCGKDLASPKG